MLTLVRTLPWFIMASATGVVALGAMPCTAAAQQASAQAQVSDAEITRAVNDELLLDRAVPSNKVDVRTVSGIVTLSGTVDNLLAGERAVSITRTVRGVRGVVDQLKVDAGKKRTDQELQKDAQAALLYDRATDSYEIDVGAANGVVTLKGKVDSFAERDLAERVVRGVAGVKSVVNQLSVAYGKTRSDAEIRADVEARLRWDALVDADRIDVNVKDGRVSLEGKVGSDAVRSRAYLDSWVVGVHGVDYSKLSVEPWQTPSRKRAEWQAKITDEQIARAVEDVLLYDPRVNSFKVTVQAAGRAVTLNGVVDNLQAKRAASEDARNTTGVRTVVNHIRVRDAGPDDKLAQHIREALERDPYIDRYDVLVSVQDGTARLSGTVDSYFEKMRADQIASRAKGVGEVRNDLAVRYPLYTLVYDPYVYDYYPYDFDWFAPRQTYTYRSDADIRGEVKDELFWSPFVDANQVRVTVDGGVVRLQGVVDSYPEMHSAVANAYEGGAVWVDNDLTVK